jgi:TolB-like protein
MRPELLGRLRERGVLRVAASYAVIAWLVLQIADVVLDPLGLPRWVMTALIIAAMAGFPLAVVLAWFLELGADGVTIDRAADGAARPSTRGLRHYADAVVIGILLIAVVVLFVRQSDIGKPKPPANPAIAVLPFENQSGDPQQEYFSDGLADEMLERLGRVPGLRVIARSSSFSFKGKDVDARTIAEKLGVTSILEGSVRRDGKRLKLSARLIDGATGQQAWSGSFDREMNDVFEVQAELARAVVDAIAPAARGDVAKATVTPTTDLNAYDLYLLAKAQLVLRTEDGLQKSIDLSRKAVELDPNFARAHAHLATSLILYRSNELPMPEDRAGVLREAESAAHRALALDPELSEAHEAYANVLRETQQPGAEDEYRRALDLNPNNAAAWHDYAVYLGNVARREADSVRATKRSLELDPRQPTTWANYLTYVAAHDRTHLRQEVERAIRTVGDMPGALGRLPIIDWSRDRAGIHAQFAQWMSRLAQVPGGPDELPTLPDAALRGFPIEILQAGLYKDRAAPIKGNLSPWLNRFRAWELVDPARAIEALPSPGEQARPGEHFAGRSGFPVTEQHLLADALGRTGNWQELNRVLASLLERAGEDDADARRVVAFWYAVQGRDQEAAASLGKAGPFPDSWVPPVLGGDANHGMIETAQVRILRGTGQTGEAKRLASRLLEELRMRRAAAGPGCRDPGDDETMRLSALAANEGLKDEAVDALKEAMRCGDLPFSFQPELPWFRSLEGYPPYDELVRERERRIVLVRAAMSKLESDPNALAPGRQ